MQEIIAQISPLWMLTREYRHIAGAGGVKDISRELAEALAQVGIDVTVFLPCYGFINPETMGFSPLDISFYVDMDYAHEERRERVWFFKTQMDKVNIILVGADRFSEKTDVYTYTEEDEKRDPNCIKGQGHFDYFAMNVLLQKAVLGLCAYYQKSPKIFHCHDGHTALVPAMMRELEGYRQFFRKTGALVTIHNAGMGYHQDVDDLPFAKANTSLPWHTIHTNLLNGSFDPLMAGASYAIANTVSENYARELQETELDAMTGWLGHALKDKGIKLRGITNGINPKYFDPKKPEQLGIPAGFDPLNGDLGGKSICKHFLLRRNQDEPGDKIHTYGFLTEDDSEPLVTVISRLTEQKGIDILAHALERLLPEQKDFKVVILGSGSKNIEDHLIYLAQREDLKGRIRIHLGYNPQLANQIYAAGDFFVIPSLYEPCGLTDFMAQLMGNLPIVRLTGGLVKVKDGFNGFGYVEHSVDALLETLQRALRLYKYSPGAIRKMQVNAIKHILENYTWEKVREKYIELYLEALKNLR